MLSEQPSYDRYTGWYLHAQYLQTPSMPGRSSESSGQVFGRKRAYDHRGVSSRALQSITRHPGAKRKDRAGACRNVPRTSVQPMTAEREKSNHSNVGKLDGMKGDATLASTTNAAPSAPIVRSPPVAPAYHSLQYGIAEIQGTLAHGPSQLYCWPFVRPCQRWGSLATELIVEYRSSSA